MKHHIKTQYCDEVCTFKWGKYSSGQTELQLVSERGEPMMTVTSNMPDSNVPEGCIVIKDYSENKGIRSELVRLGVIEPRAEMGIPSGFVVLHVHRLKAAESNEQVKPTKTPTAPSHGVDKVVRIIMRRDELAYGEAREIVEDCVQTLRAILNDDTLSAFDKLEQMTDTLNCDLGLGPDYIDELVFAQI
jgi:hypothetical protein